MSETNLAIQAVQKLILYSVFGRYYSAQEVVQILMGWSMYRSSRELVTIRLHDKNWEEINIASDERPLNSMIQKYWNRPDRLASCTHLKFMKSFFVRGVGYHQRRKVAVFKVFPFISLNRDPILTYYRQKSINQLSLEKEFWLFIARRRLVCVSVMRWGIQ